MPAETTRTLPPRDECKALPGFVSFRAQLAAAVARRDAKFLLSVADPEIAVHFGDGSGRDAFAAEWKLKEKQPSSIWPEIARMLRLGCGAEDGTAWMPYFFQRFPDEIDPFEGVVVVRPGAQLWASARGRPIRPLRLWTVIEVAEWSPRGGWGRVKLRDGKRAYVREADVRSPLHYRMIFERRKGRWMMTAFIAGD
ncbi:MAG: hypothetical protein M3Q08_08405 [Pseudomonadota bacterium]|nr:hypothetical protein [Pseudomonadota bacterium]